MRKKGVRLKRRKLPAIVARAILCGPIPKLRDWRGMYERDGDDAKLTVPEVVMVFAEQYLVVPDGIKAGQPLHLEPFQEAFIYSVFDEDWDIDEAIFSVARRNGKTFIIAIIIMAFLVGPLARAYTNIASAANSREQAALIFKMLSNMIELSPELSALTRIVPSGKHIYGLSKSTEYFAMSAEAKTGHGKSLYVVVLDEAGQVVGPTNDYVEMLKTSQGSHEDPLFITISTQAPSDGDHLSMQIDDAKASKSKDTVCHVYQADPDADLMDRRQWAYANPGLYIFRAVRDIQKQMKKALRLPALENGARNLLLNQRVSTDTLWLSPSVWKSGNQPVDLEVFRKYPVSIGLDLSQRHDLTAAVCSAKDEETGIIHLLPFVFTPGNNIRARAARDRAPYDSWVEHGQMFVCGHNSMDYDQVAETLRDMLDELGIEITTVEFDRWRAEAFFKACDEANFAMWAERNEVGQGYKDFAPRCEAFQSELLEGNIAHGGHPLLNLAASNAIAVTDPAGAIKLDKKKSTQRIDPLVAAVMAVYPQSDGESGGVDVEAMVG